LLFLILINLEMTHKVKFTAKNSSGEQTLYIDLDHPNLEGKVGLTLLGNYRGDDIQIDFNSIDEKQFAKTLRFILSQIDEKGK